MRTIDVRTTQNVTINYELALLRDRILATVIDFLIMGAYATIISILIGIMGLPETLSEGLILLLVAPPLMLYTFLIELFAQGQTFGKKAMRIRVVRLDGKKLTMYDYLLRWIFRVVDLWISLGAIAAILSTSTDNGQRLGGLVSNSTVIKVEPRMFVQLKDILGIHTKDNYTTQFDDVRNFKEEDMLLIKETLDRYKKHKNKAHREAIELLVEQTTERLGIENIPQDKIGFLKTLIKDYIVLTR